MAANSFTLLMQLGPSRGETLSVEGEEFVLGRDPKSDWMIEDVEISRRHARLVTKEGGYAIEDLGSTNGTFVNGQRIRSVLMLDPGSTIRLGENVLLFFDEILDENKLEDTQLKKEVPRVEMVENVEREEPPLPPAKAQRPVPVDPVPVSAVRENQPAEIPFYRRPVVLTVAALILLGIIALSAFLWYVDANFLWCDVFGSLIANC